MVAVIPFFPEADVERGFEDLLSVMPKKLDPLVEDTFIGFKRCNGRKDPVFSKTLWNVQELVRQNLPSTNNSTEGYRNKLQSSICAHPFHLEIH